MLLAGSGEFFTTINWSIKQSDNFLQGTVITNKNTASMNFALSVANFIVGLEWAVYGKYLGDNYVMVSSIVFCYILFYYINIGLPIVSCVVSSLVSDSLF